MSRIRQAAAQPVSAVGLGLIAFLITLRYVITTWSNRAPFDARYPYENHVMMDFRDTVFHPVIALEAGLNAYDVPAFRAMFPHAQEFDPYAPYWVTMTTPLAHLSWSAATLIWSLVGALCIGAMSVWIGRRVAQTLTDEPDRWTLISFASAGVIASWLWRPTATMHGLGNASLVTISAAAIALTARDVRVVALMTTLAWIKPQVGLPLVIILLVNRRTRLSALSGTLLAGLLSLPAVVTLSKAAGGPVELVRSVIESLQTVSGEFTGATTAGRMDAGGFLQFLGLPAPIFVSVGVGLMAVVAAGVGYHRLVDIGRPAQGALLAATAVLLGIPHFIYDTSLFMPLLVWVAAELARQGRIPWWWAASLGVLTIGCLIPASVLGSPVVHEHVMRTSFWLTVIPLNVVGVLALTRHGRQAAPSTT